MDALVTDADLVGAIAGLRALSRAGVRVIAGASERAAAGLLSRDVRRRSTGPDPCTDPRGFADHVAALARRHGPLVVYPSREESIDALLDPTADLPAEVVLPYAGPEPLRILRDKRELPALAARVGLHAPATIAEGLAAELSGAGHRAPLMVKPARRGPGIPEVTLARTDAELAEQLAAFPPGERVVLQEHVEGPLICLALVVGRDGRLVDRFQQEATRIFPPEAGACTVAVGVAPDDALCEGSVRLLAEAGYWGLAQLDFILTPAGPRLIDVNPRFYISLGLALASGVNLPAAWHAVVTGAPWPGPTDYAPGTSYRRLESDFAAALRGHPRLLLARPPAPRVGAVWSARDPLPGAWLALRRVFAFGAARAPRPWASADEDLPVTVEPLGDRAAAGARWRELEKVAGASPYLSWDWLSAWLDVYEPRSPALIRIGEPPIALGLVERRGPRWHFAGAPVTPERGLLVAEADRRRAWVALAGELSRRRGRWGSLSFESVPGEAGLLPGAELAAAPSYAVDLPGDFDEYLRARSSSQRKAHKQKLRRMPAAGGQVVPAEPGREAELLDAFLALHARRTAEKGERHPQMNARLTAMLARLARAPGARLRLFELRIDGATAGVSVRIDRPGGQGSWFYNSGFDPAHRRLGPGVVLELESIRDAIDQGHARFDLGPGLWRYKTDLGGAELERYDGEAFCPSPGGRALRASVRARRRIYDALPGRELVRSIRRRRAVSRAGSSSDPSTPA